MLAISQVIVTESAKNAKQNNVRGVGDLKCCANAAGTK